MKDQDDVTGTILLPADPRGPEAGLEASVSGGAAPAAAYVPDAPVFDLQGRLLTQSFTVCVLSVAVDDPILGNTFMDVPFADGSGGLAARCEDGTAGAQDAGMIAAFGAAQDRGGRPEDAPFVPLRPWDAIQDVSDAVQ